MKKKKRLRMLSEKLKEICELKSYIDFENTEEDIDNLYTAIDEFTDLFSNNYTFMQLKNLFYTLSDTTQLPCIKLNDIFNRLYGRCTFKPDDIALNDKFYYGTIVNPNMGFFQVEDKYLFYYKGKFFNTDNFKNKWIDRVFGLNLEIKPQSYHIS